MQRTTLGKLLIDAAEHHPSRPLTHGVREGTVTYGQAAERIAGIVAAFGRLGIERGDRIAIYSERTLPTLYLVLACAVSGVVFCPVSPLFSVTFLNEVCRRAGMRWVYVDGACRNEFSLVGLRTLCFTEVDRLVCIDDEIGPANRPAPPAPFAPGAAGALDYLRCANAGLDGEESLMLQPTSGSTGVPKLVERTHYSYVRNAEHLARRLGSPPADGRSFLYVTALTHALGISVLTTILEQAATMLVPSSIDTAVSLAEVRALDPHVLPMTPRVLRSLRMQATSTPGARGDEPLFGASARALFIGGDRADAELLARLHASGLDIIEFYGSSETGFMAMTPADGWRAGWIGPVLPDARLQIAGDGEILARTTGQMIGYLGDDEATRDAYDPDNLYLTGDLGEIGPHGYLRIMGRKRDTFTTPEGSSLYPAVIETKIESMPWVSQAFLIGDALPNLVAIIATKEELPPGPRGFIEPADQSELYLQIREALTVMNRSLEKIQRVAAFVLVGSRFPSTVYMPLSAGKVRRHRAAFTLSHAPIIAFLYRRTARDPLLTPGVDDPIP